MRSVLLAFFIFVATATTSFAATLDFRFSFTNTGNGGGAITGIVRGLLDDTADQAATKVEVHSNSDAFGIGDYEGSLPHNLFTVAGGTITSWNFTSFGLVNSPPLQTCCSLRLTTLYSGLINHPAGGTFSTNTLTGFHWQPAAQIPLPASLPLLVAGLSGLAALGRRKRKVS